MADARTKYNRTPHQQTWPSHAQRKRNAAAKHEAIAARYRAEADKLDEGWEAFKAEHWPEKSA